MSLVQQEIARRVGALFAPADQLEEQLAKACGQVDALTPSLYRERTKQRGVCGMRNAESASAAS